MGRGENVGAKRKRMAQRMARIVLLTGLIVVIVAPVSWERLPDFGLVFVPPSDAPPGGPGPGIEPKEEPPGPRIITPESPAPRSDSGEFAYFDTFGSQPPYQSTCAPVPFEIRTSSAPANGDQLIFEALQRLANTSGLSFEFKGYTDDIYDFNARTERFSWENDRQPLWIGWATADEVPSLGPTSDFEPYAVGRGGPHVYFRADGQAEVIGGRVVLRAGESLPNEFGPGANTGNLLLHELGHAMGLDHVLSDPEQMHPQLRLESPDGYGPGDSQGLQGMTMAC